VEQCALRDDYMSLISETWIDWPDECKNSFLQLLKDQIDNKLDEDNNADMANLYGFICDLKLQSNRKYVNVLRNWPVSYSSFEK
jgi:hypothetical protein